MTEQKTVSPPRTPRGPRDSRKSLTPHPGRNLARGSRLGPYELCIELASGGMATVYLARTRGGVGSSRYVALKAIHPHLAKDRTFIEMFADEAELASRIRHPNVCTVVDYDLSEGRHYLAMEYLVGEPLTAVYRKLSRRTDLDANRLARNVARILADASEGLHAAHELTDPDGEPLHVVHRDVSPENVFLTYDGVAKVVDFGVASAVRKRHRTRTGFVKGKFAYIAPELLNDEAKMDRRVDVWGIGVIAWELLTGKRLFRRETDLDTLRAVQNDDIPPPSHLRPGLPKRIDQIVMRALARDPERRYSTARELGRELARFAARGRQVVTGADLAEWMDDLFPGGRERSGQVLDLAEQVVSPQPAARERERSERDSVQPLATRDIQLLDGDGSATRMLTRRWSGAASGRRWLGRSRTLALAGAVALGAVSGSLTTQLVRPSEARGSATATTTTSAEAALPTVLALPRPHGEGSAVAPELAAPGGTVQIVQGDYAIEVVETSSDAILLRVQMRSPPHRSDALASDASTAAAPELE